MSQMIFSDLPEIDYSRSTSALHRRSNAQFFTPFSVARFMVSWVLESNNKRSLFDPAVGLGVFGRAAVSFEDSAKVVYEGWDTDSQVLAKSQRLLKTSPLIQSNVKLGDFLLNDWDKTYESIVCNPPYQRFQEYENRSELIGVAEAKLGIALSGLTNIYALFILKAVHQLAPGGRAAFIVPSEWMNADYGTFIKRHLLLSGCLKHILVFDASIRVFSDAATTASIVFLEKGLNEEISFTVSKSVSQLDFVEEVLTRHPTEYYAATDLNPNIKWRNYYPGKSARKYANLVSFSSIAKVVRGIATGSNDYFTINESDRKKNHIDSRYLLPCITKSAHCTSPFFSDVHFNELREADKRVFLIDADQVKDEFITAYLVKGQESGIHLRYLTSKRSPWFALENRPPAPIWVSVFNRQTMKFVRNLTNSRNLTTFHCIYPNPLAEAKTDLLFAFLLTPFAREFFDTNLREYGDGLEKFEPNDLNRSRIPDLLSIDLEEESVILQLLAEIKSKDSFDEELLNQLDVTFRTIFQELKHPELVS